MTTLIEKSILNERLEKSRSGIYADTSENRRKHRVGQKYGSEKKEEEKPEKSSSNEKDPAKELEAVDKVIAAINEGKLKLPQEEIMVLIEKKNNLELAKRQAEKIHSGVKANEEKRNAAEVKETSKKINEAQKKEAEKKEEPKSEPKQSEAEESYTRVKFDDVPNSGKVNLKKYLSDKVRKGVDEKWSNIKNIPTENLKKMEKGLVNDLNKNFEAIKKSQRAELLYSIMKVKGELEKRGKESQKKE